MLEIVFDRLVRIMSSTLRSFTNDNVEITMESIQSMRFGDYMNAVPSSSMFAVFKAVQWENYGLIVVDSSLSYSIIDILMGGPRGTGHAGVEARPHTAIERALIEKLITLALNDLSTAFSPVCAITLTFERLEISARFAAIARASNAVVMTRLHIDMEDRSGNMDLIIPMQRLNLSVISCPNSSWEKDSGGIPYGKTISFPRFLRLMPRFPLCLRKRSFPFRKS